MNAQEQGVGVLAVMDRALGDLMHAQVQHSYNLPLAYVESNPAEFSAAIATIREAADFLRDADCHCREATEQYEAHTCRRCELLARVSGGAK